MLLEAGDDFERASIFSGEALGGARDSPQFEIRAPIFYRI
jgi:hypothetical protein